MNFENSILELDKIVKLLESGNLSLDEAIEKYKLGIDLSVDCKKQLDEAKLIVKNYNQDMGELNDW